MRLFYFCTVLASLSASTRAFTITSPSASSYWVQFSTNTIAWSTGASDPTSVTLQIINTNATQLNGVFAIAEYVKASLESFTITNVTLVVADGYAVQMVNPLNNTQVYATSGTFGVKPSGTTPAPTTAASGQNEMNSTAGSSKNATTAKNTTSTNGSAFNNSTASNNAKASSAGTMSGPFLAGLAALAISLLRSVLP